MVAPGNVQLIKSSVNAFNGSRKAVVAAKSLRQSRCIFLHVRNYTTRPRELLVVPPVIWPHRLATDDTQSNELGLAKIATLDLPRIPLVGNGKEESLGGVVPPGCTQSEHKTRNTWGKMGEVLKLKCIIIFQ